MLRILVDVVSYSHKIWWIQEPWYKLNGDDTIFKKRMTTYISREAFEKKPRKLKNE